MTQTTDKLASKDCVYSTVLCCDIIFVRIAELIVVGR